MDTMDKVGIMQILKLIVSISKMLIVCAVVGLVKLVLQLMATHETRIGLGVLCLMGIMRYSWVVTRVFIFGVLLVLGGKTTGSGWGYAVEVVADADERRDATYGTEETSKLVECDDTWLLKKEGLAVNDEGNRVGCEGGKKWLDGVEEGRNDGERRGVKRLCG